jgi:chromate transporter
MATTGVVITSFVLISIISNTLEKFKESTLIKSALMGMRPVLIALIIKAFVDLAKESYLDLKSIIITTIIGLVLLSKKVHPILVIVIAGIMGLIFYL